MRRDCSSLHLNYMDARAVSIRFLAVVGMETNGAEGGSLSIKTSWLDAAKQFGISRPALEVTISRYCQLRLSDEYFDSAIRAWLSNTAEHLEQCKCQNSCGEPFEAARRNAWQLFTEGQLLNASYPFTTRYYEDAQTSNMLGYADHDCAALLEEALKFDRHAVADSRFVGNLRLYAASQNPGNPRAQFEYVLLKATELFEDGRSMADSGALVLAIAVYKSIIADFNKSQSTIKNAVLRGELGNALRVLGERQQGTQCLEEAIEILQQIVEHDAGVDADPFRVNTLNNYGKALQSLGEREGGVNRLREAVVVYRRALYALPRERDGLRWATTLNNLGNSLLTLSEREDNITIIFEAIEAYNEALKERTREKYPLPWATTMTNLGAAFLMLGQQTKDAECYQSAIYSYDKALQEYGRHSNAGSWAMCTGNQGAALLFSGIQSEDQNEVARSRLLLEMALDAAIEANRYELVTYYRALLHVNIVFDRQARPQGPDS